MSTNFEEHDVKLIRNLLDNHTNYFLGTRIINNLTV